MWTTTGSRGGQKDRYLDEVFDDLEAAVAAAAMEYKAEGQAKSIGVNCNAVELLEYLIDHEITPDVLTDQTRAHDMLNGYVPVEMTNHEADIYRLKYPEHYVELAMASIDRHVRAMVELQDRGSVTFDYGNNIRQRAKDHGFADAFAFPGFVPAFIRAAVLRGARAVPVGWQHTGRPEGQHCDDGPGG